MTAAYATAAQRTPVGPPLAAAIEAILARANAILCRKYTSLVLIQGIIQHFRETGNTRGLEALNQLIGQKDR